MNEANNGSRADEDIRDLATQLARTFKLLSALRERLPRVDGLEFGAEPLLRHLSTHEQVRVSDAAAALHADVSTVSRTAASLAAAGLVTKTPDPSDRRAQVLALTELGSASLAQFADQRAVLLRRVLKDWPRDDVAQLTRSLAALAASLDSALGHRAEPRP